MFMMRFVVEGSIIVLDRNDQSISVQFLSRTRTRFVPLSYNNCSLFVAFPFRYALKGCIPSEDLYALKGLVCPQGIRMPSRDGGALGPGPMGPKSFEGIQVP